ncbi:MAG: MBOAT family protein [Bacteroidales bacterium]|jgi:D-alanyl-lipoteichoic acid acyltransferase DltB (MBOAT superfamily)|nr:MBOAT family protein [Bacteroidales bacterium]
MLFNSFAFAVFLPLVFILYWSLFNRKKVKLRNLFLLTVSYVFYGWWDWRFLSLIIISSLMDYLLGKHLYKLNQDESIAVENPVALKEILRKKKFWLWVSVVVNISFLGVFKYFNFFADTLADMFALFNFHLSHTTLNIVLPVGISFYTFQTLSYTLDMYRKQAEPAKDWIQFFAFVSFFPQLVAGPIERAKNFLPQFGTLKKPDYEAFRSAMLLVAWGFFKKIMIADRLAVLVEKVYDNPTAANGFPMVLGVIFFAFQLYADFSAYSDIARGVGTLFGFNLMKNFKSPYLSTSFGNFWKRWHISLSSWFMDYVYIPLGGSRKGHARTILNILIVFAISGLWHGASWNFVIWGTLNALFLILLDPILTLNSKKLSIEREKFLPHVFKSLIIFTAWAISLIFFRAKGFNAAMDGFMNLGFSHINEIINFGLNEAELKISFILLGILLLKEIIWEWKGEIIETGFYKIPGILRWIFYIVLVLSIVFFGQYGTGNEHSFIYFQF